VEEEKLMFVDTDLLRCGAEFSRSAGAIARDGASQFAGAHLPAKMFGDFAAAEDFHSALGRAHGAYVDRMQRHQAELDALADKAHTAANAFLKCDDTSSSALHEAGQNFTDI
jgi:Protein of unknown function (DUF2563)